MSITLQFFPVVSENSLYFSELTHKYRINLKINDFEESLTCKFNDFVVILHCKINDFGVL